MLNSPTGEAQSGYLNRSSSSPMDKVNKIKSACSYRTARRVFFGAALMLSPSHSFAEGNSARDAFVREVVVTLLQTQASHISPEDTVERAYRAWNRYQLLVEGERAGTKTAMGAE